MKGNIYIIKNKINNKVYIGQTIHTIETRFLNHKAASKIEDTKFYRAIRKYGFENFYIELIEEVSEELLDEREIYWIKNFDSYFNGYNSTLGGCGHREIDYEKIYTLWKEGRAVSEIAKETAHARDAVSRILKNCFDVSDLEIKRKGQEIKYTISNEELLALWEKGLTPNQIVSQFGGTLAATKKRLISLGFTEEEFRQRATNNQRKLSSMEVDKLWKAGLPMAEISRQTGSNAQTIRKQLVELGYTSKDFDKRKRQTCNQNRRSVVQLDKNNNYIATYASAKEAERVVGAAASAISACCRHKPKYKTAKGFIWIFLEEYEKG